MHPSRSLCVVSNPPKTFTPQHHPAPIDSIPPAEPTTKLAPQPPANRRRNRSAPASRWTRYWRRKKSTSNICVRCSRHPCSVTSLTVSVPISHRYVLLLNDPFIHKYASVQLRSIHSIPNHYVSSQSFRFPNISGPMEIANRKRFVYIFHEIIRTTRTLRDDMN